MENISKEGIPTYVFISPIFPKITDWKEIILALKHFNDDFMFENLNFRSHNIRRIMDLIAEQFPDLLDFYEDIRIDPSMWDTIENEIDEFCNSQKLNYEIAFHHEGFKKK